MGDLQNNDFLVVVQMIEEARQKAISKVNEELINLYWNVGKFLYENSLNKKYGDKYIRNLADYIKKENPEVKGFNYRGLYRMKNFYNTYKDDLEIVTTLLSQLQWSCHTAIIAKTKTFEERKFYMELAIKERYSVRELERQLDSAYYTRYMLSKVNPVPAVANFNEKTKNKFLDNYVLEFLDLPESVSELELKNAIVKNLKKFIIELGKDFTFMGEEYRVQVGDEDYYIDLLFYHRGLSCLVAFELKIDNFKPEYMGKMDFYLETLDRQVKKENENPSVGVILCAKKNDEVVEYAMNRSLSPAMVSQYNLQLIDKNLLEQKLHEFIYLSENIG